MRSTRSATSSASRPGCGATPTCSTSWAGCGAQRGAARGQRRVGFYGLDLYSLHTSIEAVLGYLDRSIPTLRGRARARYACFEHFGDDPQVYGYATDVGLGRSCENEAVAQLVELQRTRGRAAPSERRPGARTSYFFAEQNARLVKNAESYYRAMFRGRIRPGTCATRTWPRRWKRWPRISDRARGAAKVVVWAHNSHLGDARATEMGTGRAERRASSCASGIGCTMPS